MSYNKVYESFYKVPRLGLLGLSDGGGPFGFDITVAIQFDYLVRFHKCDAVFETGCFLGDTTEYLSNMYPDLTIVSCDTNESYVEFTKKRLKRSKNIIVEKGNSPDVILKYNKQFKKKIYFLDAHWYENWPLVAEINSIDNGIVCVDDFDIKNERFSFDSYHNIACNLDLILSSKAKVENIYTNDPNSTYPFPCLQIGRRSGKAYFQIGLNYDPFKHSKFFKKIDCHG